MALAIGVAVMCVTACLLMAGAVVMVPASLAWVVARAVIAWFAETLPSCFAQGRAEVAAWWVTSMRELREIYNLAAGRTAKRGPETEDQNG